jgi:hypoxanthine phosphoribosyltransferase
MLEDLTRVLYHESTVLSRLDELAHQITWDYRDRELTVVAVLNGSFMFMGDLLRRIPLPLAVDCLSVASYVGDRTSGVVTFDQLTMPDIEDRHVLILDDILDSGHTLYAVRERLQIQKPKSIKLCVLLRKNKVREKPVEADYVGFDIADEFVVGYGLDFMERYRNLPCIGVLSEEIIRAKLVEAKIETPAAEPISGHAPEAAAEISGHAPE